MNIQAPRRPIGPLAEELKALLGDRLSQSPAVREQHGHDESYHPGAAPDAAALALAGQAHAGQRQFDQAAAARFFPPCRR